MSDLQGMQYDLISVVTVYRNRRQNLVFFSKTVCRRNLGFSRWNRRFSGLHYWFVHSLFVLSALLHACGCLPFELGMMKGVNLSYHMTIDIKKCTTR